ncbi:MAG: S-adenosylmethionine:tRNA ribosyltransferase-isomerase, partial [Candidatus Omnitrophota bacterium]
KIIGVSKGRASVVMKKFGQMPLPPYIRRAPERLDRQRYQTVFASKPGAVAAPTAGLHLTRRLLAQLEKKGVRILSLTLHVNYATFSPVKSEDLSGHRMQEEYFQIPSSTVRQIRKAKQEGRHVFAVGTTVAKALEDSRNILLGVRRPERAIRRSSKLFIRPPFEFRIIDALITNFHLPRTTLLMLVSAFAGRQTVLEAYREAVRQRYRFYSYGDAMLIL